MPTFFAYDSGKAGNIWSVYVAAHFPEIGSQSGNIVSGLSEDNAKALTAVLNAHNPPITVTLNTALTEGHGTGFSRFTLHL